MDNKIILDLFYEDKVGVFPMLKEQTEFEQGASSPPLPSPLEQQLTFLTGSDTALMNKLRTTLEDNARFEARPAEDEFAIKHYAGDIVYRSTGMISKNRDPLPPSMLAVMSKSKSDLVDILFQVSIAEAVRTLA